MMRFNEEHGLINLIPVVEASLHNEKRQNTEGGREERGGRERERGRYGNFSNKNVITSEWKFDRRIQLLFFSPPLEETGISTSILRNFCSPSLLGLSFLSLFEQTVETIGIDIRIGTIEIWRGFEGGRIMNDY